MQSEVAWSPEEAQMLFQSENEMRGPGQCPVVGKGGVQTALAERRAEQSKVSIFQCPAGPSNSFRKMPWLKEGTHAEGERGLGEHPPLPQVMGTLQSTEWKRRFFCFSLEASPPPPLFWTKQNVQKPAPRQQPRGERAGGGGG